MHCLLLVVPFASVPAYPAHICLFTVVSRQPLPWTPASLNIYQGDIVYVSYRTLLSVCTSV